MSEDRVDHLALLAGELGERGAARVLVDHRDERKADAGEGGDAFWLAQQGWSVTASDISQSALDNLTARARKEAKA